jgi:thymidylate synthase
MLHQVASMRSSDLILGIAYDIPAFTLFQELLALELGVECGSYTHTSNSLHIYSRHDDMIQNILKDPWLKEFPGRAKPMPPMPGKPPIDILIAAEAAFRTADTASQLQLDIDAATLNLDQYWKDWLLILAAHRAGRLGLDNVQANLMSKVAFPGYRVFKK